LRLTDHFTLDELTQSDTAVRLDIDNTPTKEVLENLKTLAEGLEHVRTKLNGNSIHVSSGYRCLELNRILHSKDTSHHVMGMAADFTCPRFGSVTDVFTCLAESGIEFEQLIKEFDLWIHISFPTKGSKGKRQVLIIDKKGKYVSD
jgi:zinc D-Ala-D-Ala carboxypeptidase